MVLHGETELAHMADFYAHVSGVTPWYRGVPFRLREVRRALVRRRWFLTQYRLWHEQRVTALMEIYGAFVSYLRFLRRQLYVACASRESMNPVF